MDLPFSADLSKFLGMDTEGYKLGSQLARLADELGRLARELVGDRPPTTAPSQERIAAGQCLQCGKDLVHEPRVRRGVCGSCYQKSRRRIRERVVTDQELVDAGLFLPETVGGRPNGWTALDDYLATRDRKLDEIVKEGQDLGEQATEKKRGKAMPKKPKR